MADKSASVRINADPRGFINGLKQTEKAAAKTGQAIQTSLSQAAQKAAAQFEKAARAMLNVGSQRGADGKFLSSSQLSKIKDMAKDVAKAYSEAYKEAVKLEQLRAQHAQKAAAASAQSRKETLGTLGTIGGAAVAGAVGLGGKAVSDANAVLEKATRIAIGARAAGTDAVDPKQLMREFFDVTQSIKGVTADQLADATAKFVSMTGDLDTARESIEDFAMVAMASGASVEDVAATAAAISQQFGITDPTQIMETLSALTFQGKAGAFELKDAASLFPMLAAAGASFGLDKGVGGVKTLGGIVQIARTGTGSGEVAATNVNAMLTALKTNADKLKLAGVNVYDKGKTRDLPTIIAEMIGKVGGTDVAKKNSGLTEILTATGFKAIAPLVTQYQDMFAQAKGKTDREKQSEAVEQLRQKIMESINVIESEDEMRRDAAMASSTFSSQMTASWERVVGGVSEKVLPKLLAFADRFSKMDGVIDTFVAGLGLAVDGLEQFNDFLRIFTGDSDKEGRISARQMEAGRQRQLAGELQRQLGEMQMRPEEIADLQKSDPAELERRRAKAMDLKRRIDEAEAFAAADDKRVEELRAGGSKPQDAINKAYGLPPTPAGDAAGRPAVKVEIPDKEMRVRVTNPKDIGARPGAPAPGWTPPRG